MSLLMEPGQTYKSWEEFKSALDTHSKENKVIFNIANAKTVEQSNAFMKRGPLFEPGLKYSHCVLQCKHYGSYNSSSAGLRPKQRSYKIDCRAFISVSACRKENYLIIRDSYHKHSHPCTEEIYNSYPEVRRMTKDERRMVGTLMEMGVPVSQIKSAVGKNVTPKDLHNAKSHIRAVKMGLKSDVPRLRPANKRNAYLHNREEDEHEQEVFQNEEIVTDSNDVKSDSMTTTTNTILATHIDDKPCSSQSGNDAVTASSGDSDMHLNNDENNSVSDSNTFVEEKTIESSELTTVSNIIHAVNSGSEPVFIVANNDNSSGDKTSYTVVVSTGEESKGSSEVVANLEELFHKLQNEGLSKHELSMSVTGRLPKTKILEQIQGHSEAVKSVKPDDKNCDNCGKYMSPLDGHSLCLACLGPQHLHQQDCQHCSVMKPEQLNIRRKLLVRMRMKALKELNESKRQGATISDLSANDSALFAPRKSKRVRKPKDFGPDMSVQNIFSPSSNLMSQKSPSKVTKCVVNDGEKEYMVEIPKREIEDDYISYSLEMESPPPISSSTSSSCHSQNTERFNHLLKQSQVFDDVVLQQCDNGVLGYEPEVSCILDINKAMSNLDLAGVPSGLVDKYGLDKHFESSYCSVPSNSDIIPGDSVVNSMGSGLHKLAQNATVQTRLAIYDKLFTRLGVGMADEALEILSQLYGKVTNVTEISQEDLTNDLQMALDTIQALKDVLEELGVMSKDALSTASHQRSISINSLDKAKKALKRPLSNSEDASSSTTKRRKFEPFTKKRLITQIAVSDSHYVSDSVSNNTPQELKFEVEDNSESSNTEEMKSQHHIVMEVASLPSDISSSVLTPVINVSPMTISSELLERLENKEGVIELNMAKEEEILVSTDHGGNTVEIHEIIHQPQEVQEDMSVHTSGDVG